MLVICGEEFNKVAVAAVSPEVFALALLVMADDGVCRAEDMACAAVVLLKADGAAVLMLALKAEDVLDRRAAEFIYALVVIADDADIPPAAGQQLREPELEVVSILIFVDEHISEAALPVIAYIVVRVKELDGVVNKVVKIHGVGREAAAGILRVYASDRPAAQVARKLSILAVLLGGYAAVLCAAYLADNGLRSVHLIVKLHVLDNVLEKTQAVGGIIDCEAACIAQPLRTAAQDAHTGGMERAGPDILRLFAEHTFKARLEFVGRLVRKGYCKDAPWVDRVERGETAGSVAPCSEDLKLLLVSILRYLVTVSGSAVTQKIRNAVYEHGGLPAARTREYQQRPLSR